MGQEKSEYRSILLKDLCTAVKKRILTEIHSDDFSRVKIKSLNNFFKFFTKTSLSVPCVLDCLDFCNFFDKRVPVLKVNVNKIF